MAGHKGHDHPTPAELLQRNAEWAAERCAADPDYFRKLAAQHAPAFLWIGCSDARVPANTLVGLDPGEVFVHRNIANQVLPRDINTRSVIDYAVGTLKVEHIFVVGHYGCGGINAALSRRSLGVLDAWLADIRELWLNHEQELAALPEEARADRLAEINVQRQVLNVGRFAAVQQAWREGRALKVHGWVYDIHDGRLREIAAPLSGVEDLPQAWRLKLDE
jgi:carbonic anhydrase